MCQLIDFLTALGQDVLIAVKPTRKRVGPHTMRAGADGCRVLDIFSPPRPEYRKAGKGFGSGE